MTGDVASVSGQAGRRELGEPVLEIEELNGVSLTVRAGEIVRPRRGGWFAGDRPWRDRRGVAQPQTGRVRMSGVDVPAGSVGASLAAGIGFVPEDRHREGLIPLRSIAENITLTADLGTVVPDRKRDGRRHPADAKARHEGRRPRQRVSALSGGNQQKVVMARALASRPKHWCCCARRRGGRALQAVTPDRGGGSGRDGQRGADRLRRARRPAGADRVLVMFHGRITAVFGS